MDTKIKVHSIGVAPDSTTSSAEFLVFPDPHDGVPAYAIMEDSTVKLHDISLGGSYRLMEIVSWLRKADRPVAYLRWNPDRPGRVSLISFHDENMEPEL